MATVIAAETTGGATQKTQSNAPNTTRITPITVRAHNADDLNTTAVAI